MRTLCCCLLVLLCTTADAHPGIGIVEDSRGNIFYTDLTHVWRIDPEGRRTIAVRNVHTHELSIDASDALYGEHLWYNGEARNTWGHFVWKRHTDGRIDTVIRAREGFRTDYSFVRDDSGTMYWVERGTKERIMKRTTAGAVTPVHPSRFSGVGWLYATPNGTLYIRDRNTLHRCDPDGTLRMIARVSPHTDYGLLHGLWSDRRGNIYLEDGKQRQVTMVDPHGSVSVFMRSDKGWAPSGGVFAADGTLWLLEYSPQNRVRVRRIATDGKIRIF
ncbi:MAG: hypothetical protein HUU02_03555 [Bacteroidetes bacterium]|nr:hypothetical protein [Bacteroidota bacterium]